MLPLLLNSAYQSTDPVPQPASHLNETQVTSLYQPMRSQGSPSTAYTRTLLVSTHYRFSHFTKVIQAQSTLERSRSTALQLQMTYWSTPRTSQPMLPSALGDSPEAPLHGASLAQSTPFIRTPACHCLGSNH